jgi:hypothetical protein
MNQLQVVNSAQFGILAGSGNILAGGDNLGVLNKITIGSNLSLTAGVLSAISGGSGSVTSVAMTTPTGLSISGSPITTSGTLAITFTTGYSIPTTASQTNWDTAYTNRITSLTTTGSSGSATLVSNILNIPAYTLSGLGGQPLATNLTSLAALSYVSTSFVKMTASGTFALDTNTYESPLTFSSPLVRTTNTISIPVATLTVSGYLSNADWGAFNAKQNSLGTGTAGQFLAYNQTWQTVPYPTALSQLSDVTFTSLSNGQLLRYNAGGWSNFTPNYVSSTFFSANAPLTYNSTTGIFSIPAATSLVDGYVTSTNFSLFYNKQSQISLTTTGSSGASTFVGTTLNIPTYTLSGLGGISLTSLSATSPIFYNSTTGVISSQAASATLEGYVTTGTQTIAGAKTFSGAATFSSSVTAQQFTNTSQLAMLLNNSGVNNDFRLGSSSSQFRIVNAANTLALLVMDNTGAATFSSSVTAISFVKTGAASTDFLKGDGTIDSNAYYLNSNPSAFIARTGISATSPVVYTSSTGVISMPVATLTVSGYLNNADWGSFNAKQNSLGTGTTSQFLRGDLTWQTVPYPTALSQLSDVTITTPANGQLLRYTAGGWINFTPTYVAAGFFSATAPLTYNSTTGVFAIPAATTSVDGYLSSTDWTTFNGKQAAINGTGFVKASGTTISYDNSTYLPLAGGTLTGVLSGTSAIFSSTLQATDYRYAANGYLTYDVAATGTNTMQIRSGYAGAVLSFTGLGAATFSSSVTANGGFVVNGNASISSTAASIWSNTYLQFNSGSAGISWNNSGNTVGLMQLTNSGNLGLGVTPSAWSLGKVIQVGSTTSVFNDANGSTYFGNNFNYNSNFLYLTSNYATSYVQTYTGEHRWNIAPAGTAGGTISFTQAMTLTAGGNVLIGFTTNSGYKLDVNGTARIVGTTSIVLTTTNTSALAVTQYSITGANSQSLLDLAGAWNTTGNPTAIKLNITNTASGASSNLMDLQVGAVSKFKVDKAGLVTGDSFYESSDKRQKTLIEDNFQAKGIENITPKLYTKNDKVELGYYAQDIQGILDGAVSEDEKGMLSLSYREVHTAKIYALELEIKELKELIKSIIDGNRN